MRLLVLLMLVGGAAAAQPRVSGAPVQTRAAQGSVESLIQQVGSEKGPVWIAYSVKATPRDHSNCCYYWNDGGGNYRGCALEEKRVTGSQSAAKGPVRLESSSEFFMLLRVAGGAMTKLRTFSADCELDATGAELVYFTGVSSAQSLEYLRKLSSEPAVGAIAMHDGPEAFAILESFASASQSEQLRKKALFWMGLERGKAGVDFLTRVLKNEVSGKLRESAVQGLAMSKEPEALPLLLSLARNDPDSHVRGSALFWIAQKASAKAVGTLRDAIDNDPEVQVKEKAVFALSQLPADQGVPLLIDTARNNKLPAVRRKAMFWLGQSKDPRAVKFFEEVLAR